MVVAKEGKPQTKLQRKLEEIFGFDLRSLALFRIGLALVILADLWIRAGEIKAHYSDQGILPRVPLIDTILNPWYWSINLISGQPLIQSFLFAFSIFITLMLLIGYRTRLATIICWAMIISLHNRNPALIFAADDVLRAILFWCMFLPLGAYYSVDSALNNSTKPLPKRFLSIATFALMVQQCYIYMFSAWFKHQSPLWSVDGSAVYYSFSFDQYATPLGQFLLQFDWLLPIMTFGALWFEWLAPLIIFIPWRNSLFKAIAVVSFIGLHISFGLCFTLGIFPFLSTATWFAFIPSFVWDKLAKRYYSAERAGLKINYDVNCGFCQKMVRFLRTFLLLPSNTPLKVAQDDPSIYADMQAHNSWVVEDWQNRRYFKWEGMIYVVSLSPILGWLAPVLRIPPLKVLGTKIYETIANNRSLMGKLTAPFKYDSFQVRRSLRVDILAAIALILTTVWNFRSFASSYIFTEQPNKIIKVIKRVTNSRTMQKLDWLSKTARLNQSWSIFAPNPPRDDGWHVIKGKLKNGKEVDLLYGGEQINWQKPTIKQRNRLYKNMQWRTFFINLNRNIGKKLYPNYANYLCSSWNEKHQGEEQLDSLEIYFMSERTVPPGEEQTVEKTKPWQQDCQN